jgi:hypothetical protein
MVVTGDVNDSYSSINKALSEKGFLTKLRFGAPTHKTVKFG